MYGGSLSSRRIGPREDVSGAFLGTDLDQRLPTSARGSSLLAAERLAALGVLPGRYSGVEQVFSGADAMTAALEPCACDIRNDGSLAVASQATGELTIFGWVLDRWRWCPPGGITVEALPRRLGAVIVVDFYACDGPQQRPAGRFYLAERV